MKSRCLVGQSRQDDAGQVRRCSGVQDRHLLPAVGASSSAGLIDEIEHVAVPIGKENCGWPWWSCPEVDAALAYARGREKPG